jgi:hypothetical protein
MELDGSPAGLLQSPAVFATGQIVCQCGSAMSKEFYSWVAASIGATALPKSGAIIMADFNWTAKARMQFTGARILEVGFPRLSPSSVELASLKVRFHVSSLSQSKDVGGQVALGGPHAQRKWLCNLYQLTIPGIEASAITQIEPIDLRHGSPLPEMQVMVKSAKLAGFKSWITTGEPRSGSLKYLSTDLQPFCTLSFGRIRIAAIDDAGFNKIQSMISSVRVRLAIGEVCFTQP